jgi:hypothetical protein
MAPKNLPGIGLGNARNIGLTSTTMPLIVSMVLDDLLPVGRLQTIIVGADFVSQILDARRKRLFLSGRALVRSPTTLFYVERISAQSIYAVGMSGTTLLQLP